MDSIEAHRVKNVPGNLQALRQPEEGTANQCPTTKESTGAPVSASEQDSHNREPAAVEHATGQGEQWLPLGKPRLLVADKDRLKEPVHFGARAKCDPPVSGTCHPQSPPSRTEPAREATESAQIRSTIAGYTEDSIFDATCGPDASSPKRIDHYGAELAPSGDATPAIAEKPAGFEEP